MSTSGEDSAQDSQQDSSNSDSSDYSASVPPLHWDPMDAETYRLILLWLDPLTEDMLSSPATQHQEALENEDAAVHNECVGWREWAHDPEISRLRRANRRLRAGVVRITKHVARQTSRRFVEGRSTYDMIVKNIDLQYTPNELKLRQDMAANKVVWYGDWWQDLWCFLRNNNPVLSICFSHPLHPVSRFQRWMAYLLQAIFVFYVSSALSEARHCVECNIRGCQMKSYRSCFVHSQEFLDKPAIAFFRRNYPGLSRDFCCAANNCLMVYFLETSPLGGPLYAMLANCVFTVVVFQMMMCLCMQKRSPRVRELSSCLGYAFVAIIGGVLVFFSPLVIYYLWISGTCNSLFSNFFMGKLGGWAFVTLLNVIGFSFMWRMETPNSGEGPAPRKFWVTAGDFRAFASLHPEGPDPALLPSRASTCCGHRQSALPAICEGEDNPLVNDDLSCPDSPPRS